MLTVHHLNNSRSQRVLWLLEELGVPYEIVRYQRQADMRAPKELRAIHPLGKSPVITDGGNTIAESGAIVDYIIRRYGKGAMMPAPGSVEYETYNEWLHYSEGSAMLPLMLNLYVSRLGDDGEPLHARIDGEIANHLGYLDRHLEGRSYLLGEEVGVGWRYRAAPRWTVDLATRFERTSSVETRARPIRREYQPNPELGSGSYWLARAALTFGARGALDRSDLKATIGLEGGVGETEYLRLSFRSDGSIPLGGGLGHFRVRTTAGLATAGLPRSRSFAIGGRGTLPAERFRGYGGRRVATLLAEWRIPVPAPAIGLGPFANTGNRAILAPLFGIGWAGGAIEDLPWGSSNGPRPVAGVALEVLHGLIRFELAHPLRQVEGQGARLRLTVDISPEWWPIL